MNWATPIMVVMMLVVCLLMAAHIVALRQRLERLKSALLEHGPASQGDDVASPAAESIIAPGEGVMPHTCTQPVFTAMSEAVVHVDAQGQVHCMNSTAERLLGWRSQDAAGRPMEEVAPLVSSKLFVDVGGGRERVSYVVTQEGERLPVVQRRTDLNGEVATAGDALWFTRDVSRELSLQDDLASARHNFREVIRKTPYGVVVLQARRMVYVNPCWASTMGYGSSKALVGTMIDDILWPGERTAGVLACFETVVAPSPTSTATFKSGQGDVSGGARELREVRFRRRDGEVVVMELSPARAIRFDRAEACLVVARDITEIKKMQTQLMIADRMVSVGTLAAGVAHEINNPLSYVIANIDFIKDELKDASRESRAVDLEEISEVIHEASEGAERVRAIVQDLKTFSRSDDEGRGALDVHEVLESAIKLVWNEVRHCAALVRCYAEVLPPVLANESRLGQVFLNLLVNAAQAMPEGEAESHHIKLTTLVNAKGQVVVRVADNGPGIAPEHLKRIFDPFFTTKPVGVGTGLGLSICHNIITALDGRLTVESVVGAGTTFEITLPVSERAPSSEDDDERAADVEPGLRGRILVVDDDLHVSRALKRTLRAHDVETVNNGREAIRRCLSHDYDFILCDLMMPDITGMDVYSALSLKRPEMANKMIFMTGGAFTARARQFLDGVVNPRIDKPFEQSLLRQMIREGLVAAQRPHGEGS